MENTDKFKEEFEKYMGQEKEKKVYSVNLTKENVEYIRSRLKVPFSKVIDDIIGAMTISFKRIEREKKAEEDKASEEKDSDAEEKSE
jgi:hypothetical protein